MQEERLAFKDKKTQFSGKQRQQSNILMHLRLVGVGEENHDTPGIIDMRRSVAEITTA